MSVVNVHFLKTCGFCLKIFFFSTSGVSYENLVLELELELDVYTQFQVSFCDLCDSF